MCGIWKKEFPEPEAGNNILHILLGSFLFLLCVVLPISILVFLFRTDIVRITQHNLTRFQQQQQQQVVEKGEEADERIPLRPLDLKPTGENEAKYCNFWKVNLTF